MQEVASLAVEADPGERFPFPVCFFLLYSGLYTHLLPALESRSCRDREEGAPSSCISLDCIDGAWL